MHWKDLLIGGEWQGLEITIGPGELAPRPPLRVEAALWNHLRVMSPDGPLLWTSQHQGREGVWWLAADREHKPVVPPITAAELRAVPETPPSREYWATWARWFTRKLMASPLTPLRAGSWALAYGEHGPAPRRWQTTWGAWPLAPARGLVRSLNDPPFGWASWIGGGGDALRLGSAPAKDRVWAWRKRAKDGTLPPVLVMLARGMGGWLILDGHARMAAALAESTRVPILHLFLASADHDGQLSPSSQAWPLPGGTATWKGEVGDRLAVLGRPANHALLDGLAPYEAHRLGRPTG